MNTHLRDSASPRSGRTGLITSLSDYAGMLAVLGLLIVVFSSQNPRFLAWPTLWSILNQIPALTVVASGMTLVLITGAIDLSVGSVLALSSSVIGVLMVDHQWPLPAAAGIGLAAGAACGLLTGTISVQARIPSFIVSLGVLEIARGSAYLLTGSQVKFIGEAVEGVSRRWPGTGISPAFVLCLGVVATSQWILSRTVFGRYCIATGTNEAAVRMSGVDSRPVRIGVFVISGVLAAAAGLMETSRMSAADPNGAVGFELAAIAAAVIGGTSLMGGRGSIINTFFGVLIIAILQTGLSQLGVDDGSKKIVTGSVIVFAVIMDASRMWLRMRIAAALSADSSPKASTGSGGNASTQAEG